MMKQKTDKKVLDDSLWTIWTNRNDILWEDYGMLETLSIAYYKRVIKPHQHWLRHTNNLMTYYKDRFE